MLILLPAYADSTDLKASTIISKAIDSYGDVEKWQAIKGWSATILMEDYSSGETRIYKHYVRLPDKFRFDVEVNRKGRKEIFQLIYNAGVTKYLKDGRKVERTSSEMFSILERRFREYRRMQAPTQFKYFNNIKNEMKLIGKENVRGRECYILEYRHSDRTKARVFIDTKTFRSVKQETDKGFNDKFIEAFLDEQTLKVNGMEFPAVRWVYNDKELVAKLEYVSISSDLPDESLFEF